MALLASGGVVCAALSRPASASGATHVILAVGAENQYANVLSQIGGKYVSVAAILKNPNTDPHTFEASASVAEEIAQAQLIVQNGVGYDSFMNNIEDASPNSSARSSPCKTCWTFRRLPLIPISGTNQRPCLSWRK
jgi:zinc/manganese transport system substrate-binding protein